MDRPAEAGRTPIPPRGLPSGVLTAGPACAVCFDLDLTLVEYDPDPEGMFREACERAGLAGNERGDLREAFVEGVRSNARSFEGDPFLAAARDLVADFDLPVAPERFSAAVKRAELAAMVVPPGVPETLAAVAASHPVAVVTGGYGPVQRRKLRRTGLLCYADVVVTSTDVRAHKPDTALLRAALGALSRASGRGGDDATTAPADALVVGDSVEGDLEPALELGLDAVLVGARDPRAACSLDGPADLPRLLDCPRIRPPVQFGSVRIPTTFTRGGRPGSMAKQPHILAEQGDVTDLALVPGDPGRVERIAGHCENVEGVAQNREYRLVNAEYEGRELTICSTGIGCPSAAIAVEELSRIGVETFLRVGTTGALQSGIEIGDMVVATGAAKNEGTSKRYEAAEYPAVPDYDVLSALVDGAEANGEDVHVGPIASDDAFYAETDAYVEDWEEAGILSVEMEAATIFTLARRKDLRAGAICTVDGNLVEGTQKGETDAEELPEKARDNVERAIDISLTAAARL